MMSMAVRMDGGKERDRRVAGERGLGRAASRGGTWAGGHFLGARWLIEASDLGGRSCTKT